MVFEQILLGFPFLMSEIKKENGNALIFGLKNFKIKNSTMKDIRIAVIR